MRNLETLAVIAATSAVWSLAGCDGMDAESPQVGTARLTLVDETHAAASLRATATESATGKIADQTMVTLSGQASSTVYLALPKGKYVLNIEAFADTEAKVLLSAKSTEVDVNAGLTTDLAVRIGVASASPSTGAGAGAGGGMTGGPVAIDINDDGSVSANVSGGGASASAGASVKAPAIEGVDVSVGATTARISIKADAVASGKLTFTWSGAGIGAATAGSASADLSVLAILDDLSRTTTIVVQNESGAAVEVRVTFHAGVGVLGGLSLLGTASTSIVAR